MIPSLPPEQDFSRPLDLIHSNHLRLEQRASLLLRLVAHLHDSGHDEQARQTAGHILRYFADSGILHHEDEERDLFPAMLETVAETGREALLEMVTQLTRQHREMSRLWDGLRRRLERIVAGEIVDLDADICARFHALYVEHIAREENELMPIARACLNERQIAQISERMASRRAPA